MTVSDWVQAVLDPGTVPEDETEADSGDRLLTPPHGFVDAEDRPIQLSGFDGDGLDSLVAMYAAFDPSQRAQGVPPLGDAAIREWLEKVLTDLSVLARHEGQVIGHVMLVAEGDSPPELAIFVHPDYQRAGIGSKLLRAGLGHARDQGMDRVWLSVEKRKQGLHRFYRRLGFRVTDPRGSTYRMARRL